MTGLSVLRSFSEGGSPPCARPRYLPGDFSASIRTALSPRGAFNSSGGRYFEHEEYISIRVLLWLRSRIVLRCGLDDIERAARLSDHGLTKSRPVKRPVSWQVVHLLSNTVRPRSACSTVNTPSLTVFVTPAP